MNPGVAQALGLMALRAITMICGTAMAIIGYYTKDVVLGGAGVTLVTTATVSLGQDPFHVDRLVKETAQAATAAASTTKVTVEQAPAPVANDPAPPPAAA